MNNENSAPKKELKIEDEIVLLSPSYIKFNSYVNNKMDSDPDFDSALNKKRTYLSAGVSLKYKNEFHVCFEWKYDINKINSVSKFNRNNFELFYIQIENNKESDIKTRLWTKIDNETPLQFLVNNGLGLKLAMRIFNLAKEDLSEISDNLSSIFLA